MSDEGLKAKLVASPLAFETAEEYLAAWDSGDILLSISMGGLGPEYEHALQTAAAEALRVLLRAPRTMEEYQGDSDLFQKEVVGVVSPIFNSLVLSGAQAHGALNLAINYARDGHADALCAVPRDRWYPVWDTGLLRYLSGALPDEEAGV